MNPTCRTEQGVALIEVVIAMVLLLFGLMGSVGMASIGRTGTGSAWRLTEAVALAETRLETLRGLPMSGLLSALEGEAVMEEGDTNIFEAQEGRYTSTRTVTFLDANQKLASLEVVVTWEDAGKPHRVRLVELIADATME
jgi:hypothetical protein